MGSEGGDFGKHSSGGMSDKDNSIKDINRQIDEHNGSNLRGR